MFCGFLVLNIAARLGLGFGWGSRCTTAASRGAEDLDVEKSKEVGRMPRCKA